ncbi:MAG TPA: hypothetical protein VFS20_32685 [Longimicrobium sp.]|nr:hypothetical protein [Longimicrobium sp.]
MSGATPAQAHSFVLRLWAEPGGGGDVEELRGEIRHVPSGTTAYFRRLEGVAAALRTVLRQVEEAGEGTFTHDES